MKNIFVLFALATLLLSCASDTTEDAKTNPVDQGISEMCDCCEKNKADWLATNKECGELFNSWLTVLKEKGSEEDVARFTEEALKCNKYHAE